MDDEKSLKMNYQPNSHKARDAAEKGADRKSEKKVEKIIQGEVTQRKKPLGRRIAENFTGDDVHSVGSYVLFEVMLPALKTMIADAGSQGLDRMLFGDSRSARANRGGYTSYNKMHTSGKSESARVISTRARATHDFREIIIDDRGEAESVIERLRDLISNYDTASVSDLYACVGITGNFTDEKWGWTDLRSAAVRYTRGGYLLELPPAQPLD